MKINCISIFARSAERLVVSKSIDKDIARREYIFNTLLLSFILLTFTAFLITLLRHLNKTTEVQFVSVSILILPLLIFTILYFLSRNHFRNSLVYNFIGIVGILGTYSLYKYGYILAQGLLIYVLVIIMSGIMISARASIYIAIIIFFILSILANNQINQQFNPYINEINEPLNVENLIVYILIFTIIFLVSWLSNREIESSLKLAKQSEKELMAERNKLEIKVKQRSEELERAQVEKSMELYRFAEFGRLSSSFLHDLANPLTVVSLNLEQLSTKRKSRVVIQAQKGVTYMEEYVQSARRQLRSQSEHKIFDTKYETEKVVSFLSSKSQNNQVKLVRRLAAGAEIYGDCSKFSQIIANLIANGIDSYNSSRKTTRKTVIISSRVFELKSTVLLSIKDEGEGILPHEQDKIFNPFFTTKSTDRGTGIGLTITKRIVEEDFKGTINFKSDKYGTTFLVEIPLYNKLNINSPSNNASRVKISSQK